MGHFVATARCASVLTVAALALATPAVAAAPESQQIAECAGTFEAAAHWAADDLTARQMTDAAERWIDASIEQARAEGQFYPAYYANTLRERARVAWIFLGRNDAQEAGLVARINACLDLDPVTHIVVASD